MIYHDRSGQVRTPDENSVVRHRSGAFAVSIQSNRILLIWPQFAPHVAELPGGGIDSGETPEQACRREFSEETGMTLTGDLTQTHQQDVYFYASDSDEYWQYHQTFFTAQTDETHMFEDLRPTPENGMMGWVDLDELRDVNLHHMHRQALIALGTLSL